MGFNWRSKRNIFGLAVIGLVLVAIGLAIYLKFWFLRGESFYFGRVVEVAASELTITGRQGTAKVIILPETEVMSGSRSQPDTLKIGERIMVIGSADESGAVRAKTIRIYK